MMTTNELAWVAGIFEGEGCLYKDPRRKKDHKLQVVMTDKDIVERLHRITGVGIFAQCSKPQQPHYKDHRNSEDSDC